MEGGARVSESSATPQGTFLRLGLTVALVLLVVDQATKLSLIYGTTCASPGRGISRRSSISPWCGIAEFPTASSSRKPKRAVGFLPA